MRLLLDVNIRRFNSPSQRNLFCALRHLIVSKPLVQKRVSASARPRYRFEIRHSTPSNSLDVSFFEAQGPAVAHLLCSPLASLCFSLNATRSARLKPSWAVTKLIEWEGVLEPRQCDPAVLPHQDSSPAAEAYRSGEPHRADANADAQGPSVPCHSGRHNHWPGRLDWS